MDLKDLQDDRRSDYQFGEITEKIIGCAFEVINELKAAKAIAPEHQAQSDFSRPRKCYFPVWPRE